MIPYLLKNEISVAIDKHKSEKTRFMFKALKLNIFITTNHYEYIYPQYLDYSDTFIKEFKTKNK